MDLDLQTPRCRIGFASRCRMCANSRRPFSCDTVLVHARIECAAWSIKDSETHQEEEEQEEEEEEEHINIDTPGSIRSGDGCEAWRHLESCQREPHH
eukprot:6129616-Amphidinium_carterae.1